MGATSAMIRVQVLSDLHAELDVGALLTASDVATGADIVIIAGDMALALDSVKLATRLFRMGPWSWSTATASIIGPA